MSLSTLILVCIFPLLILINFFAILSLLKDSIFMDIIITVFLYILLFSGVIRHVVRTISFIVDLRSKFKSRRLEVSKH